MNRHGYGCDGDQLERQFLAKHNMKNTMCRTYSFL
jgi:hypothetical protein